MKRKKRQRRFGNAQVAAVFRSYPSNVRKNLLALRELIFDVAEQTEGVGELQETLKWGQPSYVPAKTRSGTPIRIDDVKSVPGAYAMYFHCQTTLVGTFRRWFGDELRFGGNRSIELRAGERVPVSKLRQCVASALTYHRRKPTAPKKGLAR